MKHIASLSGGEISENCTLFSKSFECFFLPTSHCWHSSLRDVLRFSNSNSQLLPLHCHINVSWPSVVCPYTEFIVYLYLLRINPGSMNSRKPLNGSMEPKQAAWHDWCDSMGGAWNEMHQTLWCDLCKLFKKLRAVFHAEHHIRMGTRLHKATRRST